MFHEDQLRPSQKYVISEATRLGSCAITCKVDSGKTIIGLTIARNLLSSGVDKVLIVAPKRVIRKSWDKQRHQWEHTKDLQVFVMDGAPIDRETIATRGTGGVYLIGQDLFPWLVEKMLHEHGGWPFSAIIFDDVEISSSDSQRFKSAKKIRPFTSNVIHMSGTPIGNSGYMGLWPLYRIIDGGKRLGYTKTGFIDRFCQKGFMQWDISFKPGAEKEIDDLIKDVTLYAENEDQRPEPDHRTYNVTLPAHAVDMYNTITKDLILYSAMGKAAATTAAVLSTKLRQISSGVLYVRDDEECEQWENVHEERLRAVGDIIKTHCHAHAVIAYWFKSSRERLLREFPQSMAIDERGALDLWDRGELPILIMHPLAGGHGLNLQSGGYLQIWYDLAWSVKLNQQFDGRLNRQGQKNNVVIYRIVSDTLVDSLMIDRIKTGEETQKSFHSALLEALKGGKN